jgi:hypothetical protein
VIVAAGVSLGVVTSPAPVEGVISVAVFVKVTYRMAAMPALAVAASSADLTPETPTAPMV